MTDAQETAYGEWLNQQGYDINLNDWLWMEDKLPDHSFRDMIELIDRYYIHRLLKALEDSGITNTLEQRPEA